MKMKFLPVALGGIALSVAGVVLLSAGGSSGLVQRAPQSKTVVAAPPSQIPQELLNDFTLEGSIPVSNWYRDDSQTSTAPVEFTPAVIDANLERIVRREQNYYGATDTYLYAAFDKYKAIFRDEFLNAKSIAIIGSTIPWYESIVLSYGGIPTTIEYNKIINSDPRLEVLTVEEFDQNPRLFDVIVSISSIEHDGLGRYGDPINPNGDFAAMSKMKSMLRENGLLFLSVPIAKDRLWWNVHRIYGRIRFPMLIKEWDLIDSFGFQDSDLDCDRGMEASSYQPVFVLRPKG